MTKKDFELIAEAIKEWDFEHSPFAKEPCTSNPTECLAESLAVKLEDTNERFDKQRFLTACGLELEASKYPAKPLEADWEWDENGNVQYKS